MKRFFNKRAVPTLVTIALSIGAFIVGDFGAQKQVAGADGKGGVTAADLKIGGNRDPSLEADRASKAEEAYQASVQNQLSGASSLSDFRYYQEFLQDGKFNVDTTCFTVKLDPKTGKLKRDPKTGLAVPDEYTTTFVKDEFMCLETRSNKDGYLYVIDIGAAPDNKITLLYPADVTGEDGKVIESFDADNSVKAGEKVAIPKPGVRIRTGQPFGTEMLLTIVTNKKIKPEKLRKLANSGEVADAISAQALAELTKDLHLEEDGGAIEIGDPNIPFEYGVQRLYIHSFETEAEKKAFLAKPQTIFVGIGIGKYKNGIRSLSSCVNDVKELAELLKTQGAVEEGNVILLTDENATVENIKFLFTSFLPAFLKPGDRVIIHWSSHGVTEKDMGAYFVTYEAKELDFETMVSSDDLNIWASNMRDKKILFIFDACYSGAAIDPNYNWAKDSRNYEKALGGDNLSIVASSAPEETSAVRKDNTKFSLMTSVLLDYLNAHRDVNAIELGHSIAEEVNKLAETQFKRSQKVLSVQGKDGEFIINPTN